MKSASGHFANGDNTDITNQVLWFSFFPFTATVTQQGLVRGVHPGKAAIVTFWPFAIGVASVTVTS